MAFPTTGVLDNFNRADAGPPPSASWTTLPFSYGPPGHVVTSNRMGPDAGGAYSGSFAASYWSAATFGPDSEMRFAVPTWPSGRVVMFMRLRQIASGTTDGYEVSFDVTADEVKINRNDNEVATQLGATISQSVTVGDSIGGEVIGSNLAAYIDVGTTGSWSASLGSRSDATYSSSGNLGVYTDDVGTRLDDFGGGSVVASTVRLLACMGVGS